MGLEPFFSFGSLLHPLQGLAYLVTKREWTSSLSPIVLLSAEASSDGVVAVASSEETGKAVKDIFSIVTVGFGALLLKAFSLSA